MHYEFLSGGLYELFSEFSLKATIALDLVLNTTYCKVENSNRTNLLSYSMQHTTDVIYMCSYCHLKTRVIQQVTSADNSNNILTLIRM
jgi:hypothetical protein